MNNVTIRKFAIERDIDSVAELSGQLGYPSTPAQLGARFEAIAQSSNQTTMVALNSDNQLVGWIHLRTNLSPEIDPSIEVSALIVDHNCRGLGIGAKLLEAGEQWAYAQGFNKITLKSNILRTDAHRFYLRHGYRNEKTSHLFEKNL